MVVCGMTPSSPTITHQYPLMSSCSSHYVHNYNNIPTGILLISSTLTTPLPIPTSGGELPVTGTGLGMIGANHIPPLSVSWSAPWPVSHTTRDSKISVCKIWCGLMLSLLIVVLITPTSTTSPPSQVSSEEVSETRSPMREGTPC